VVHLDTFACGELLGVPLTRYVHLRRTTRCPTYSIHLLPVNYPVFHIFEMRLLDTFLRRQESSVISFSPHFLLGFIFCYSDYRDDSW